MRPLLDNVFILHSILARGTPHIILKEFHPATSQATGTSVPLDGVWRERLIAGQQRLKAPTFGVGAVKWLGEVPGTNFDGYTTTRASQPLSGWPKT